MRKFFDTVGVLIRRFTFAPLRFTIPILAIVAFVLNIILEMFSRKSLLATFAHAVTSPLVFAANMLIILFTLTICLLIRRRLATLTLLFCLWLALGIINSLILSYRSSPLSAIDFLIAKDAITMATAYFSVIQLVLLALLIVAALALIVFLFIKCPKCKVNYIHSLISIAAVAVACPLFVAISVSGNSTSGDLMQIYRESGFTYCFTRSVFVHGVERPDEDMINRADEFMDKLSNRDGTDTSDIGVSTVPEDGSAPNIVVVQLESFFDVKHITDADFSKDPIPNFTALKQEGVSGFLQVPHVGGGTANIEFEFLTGMNLDHFGLGEFPYTMVLKTQACETLAANLKTLDYSTHAIHNHIATFYDRNIVYPNLGFDTFTSIEMMTPHIKRNILGWASDSLLVDEIESALDSTQGQDFVFAVSVQGHGGYPDHSVTHVVPPTDEDVEVYGFEDEKIYYQYHFYTNLIREMDEAVGEICAMLEERGEPYVVVFYGDHLPAIPLVAEQLDNGDMYQTEYAIKTNIDLPGLSGVEDPNELDADLETYQLAAYIQKLCGMSVGEITLLHQHEFDVGEKYDDILQTLEYEQLYDNTKSEYLPAEMTFGTDPIVISSYSISGNTLVVKGDGFNTYSKVKINGTKRNTKFMDEFTLHVENVISRVNEVDVVQVADDGTELAYAVKAE